MATWELNDIEEDESEPWESLPTTSMATGKKDDTDEGTSVIWSSLLEQAQANRAQAQALLAQSQALLAQSRCNEETSRALHLLTQRMPSKGATEMAPDRLEAWYAAECDAKDGVTIAGAIAKQAEGLQEPGKCDGQVSGDVISIKSTGKISGEVFYENISIEEGAVVEAQIGKRKSKN